MNFSMGAEYQKRISPPYGHSQQILGTPGRHLSFLPPPKKILGTPLLCGVDTAQQSLRGSSPKEPVAGAKFETGRGGAYLGFGLDVSWTNTDEEENKENRPNSNIGSHSQVQRFASEIVQFSR